MTRSLLRRYGSGKDDVAGVLAALDALAGRARFDELSALFCQALALNTPVPQAMWRWAAEHAEYLDAFAARDLLDGVLRGQARVTIDVQRACTSRDFLLATLAHVTTGIARSEDGRLGCASLARRVTDAACAQADRGFNYDATAVFVLDALQFLARHAGQQAHVLPTLPDAPAWLVPALTCAALATQRPDRSVDGATVMRDHMTRLGVTSEPA
jgi:hypothetical protein